MIGRKLRLSLFICILLISTSCTVPNFRDGFNERLLEHREITNGALRERYSVITYEREIQGGGTQTSDPVLVRDPVSLGKQLETLQGKTGCPVFELPEAKAMPKLPKLSARQSNDPEETGAVLIDHIAELRDYIKTREQQLLKSYGDYREKCK